MSAEKSKPSKPPVKQIALPAAAAKSYVGSADRDFAAEVLNQVIQSLRMPSSLSEEQRDDCVAAAFAALKGIGPRDELEGMLAAQMVATHSAAMECLRRAMIEGQTFEGRDQNLRHAAKLLGVYARQIEAIDKHRGKGQQKITVEHVTVNAGGQAIVGNVGAGEAAVDSGAAVSADRAALTHDPAPLAPQFEVARLSESKKKTLAR